MPELLYHDASIHYRINGSVDRLMICIHGFSGRASDFDALLPVLTQHFTVVSFDLPFHGKTQWPRAEFTPADIADIIDRLTAETGFERFCFMGHSMGGRIIFNILEQFAPCLDGLYLFAPAGLYASMVFKRGLVPMTIRKLGRKQMLRWKTVPKWFQRLKETGIIPKYGAGLVEIHFSADHRRERMLNIWVSMHHFRIQPDRHKEILKRYHIPVFLYMGERDKAIPLWHATKFCNDFPLATLHVMHEGHFVMTAEAATLLDEDLNKGNQAANY